jgi:hypothetical protein
MPKDPSQFEEWHVKTRKRNGESIEICKTWVPRKDGLCKRPVYSGSAAGRCYMHHKYPPKGDQS